MIDYYLVRGLGLIAEEFELGHDYTTVGLRSSLWSGGQWRGVSGRQWRGDPALLAKVTPVDRAGAEAAYGGALPVHDELPWAFEAFAGAPVLRLRDEPTPDGFRERRVYRVLFAGDATAGPVGGETGERRTGGAEFEWRLHRVGGGIAWALDITVLLAGEDDSAVGVVLRDLVAGARGPGLVPVTTERFA